MAAIIASGLLGGIAFSVCSLGRLRLWQTVLIVLAVSGLAFLVFSA